MMDGFVSGHDFSRAERRRRLREPGLSPAAQVILLPANRRSLRSARAKNARAPVGMTVSYRKSQKL